jgi:hypothetical protein
MPYLLDDVNRLLKLEVGDIARLNHIKETLEQNKIVYVSDRTYIEKLATNYLNQDKLEDSNKKQQDSSTKYTSSDSHDGDLIDDDSTFCGKCGNKISDESNFCPKCGVSTNNENMSKSYQNRDLHSSQKISQHDNSGIKSYQILSIIGGVLGILVTLAYSVLFSFVDIVGSSFGSGIEESTKQYFSAAVPLVIIIYISCFIIPFVIKKTKTVGIYLIISAFVVIIASSSVGIIGFALLLPAGIISLRRH